MSVLTDKLLSKVDALGYWQALATHYIVNYPVAVIRKRRKRFQMCLLVSCLPMVRNILLYSEKNGRSRDASGRKR